MVTVVFVMDLPRSIMELYYVAVSKSSTPNPRARIGRTYRNIEEPRTGHLLDKTGSREISTMTGQLTKYGQTADWTVSGGQHALVRIADNTSTWQEARSISHMARNNH